MRQNWNLDRLTKSSRRESSARLFKNHVDLKVALIDIWHETYHTKANDRFVSEGIRSLITVQLA